MTLHSRQLQGPGRLRLLPALLPALLLLAGNAYAELVSMPTPQGNVTVDSNAFASAYLEAPTGAFACFAAGALSDCNADSLPLAVLGPDLGTGLSLGQDGAVTLAIAPISSSLAIWEAGSLGGAGDLGNSLISVRTVAGWTTEHAFGPGRFAPVLNDTMPSGYATNYATFSAADFGLPEGSVFDAVRIRACCGSAAHPDLLAIAAVPEPAAWALLLAGVFAVGGMAHRRMPGPQERPDSGSEAPGRG